MSTKCVFLCLTLFGAVSLAQKVPPITPCKAENSDCILNSAKAVLPYMIEGIPEYNIPPAEPIELKTHSTKFDELSFSVLNLKVYGLPKTELLKIVRDPGTSTVEVTLQAPILIKGNYEAHGKLLSVPVEGNGDLEISVDNVIIIVTIKLETLEKNGKKYYKINDFTFKYEIQDYNNVKIILTNLFGGDKEKAEPVYTLIDTSKPILIAGIGDPIIKDIIGIVVHNHIEKLLLNVPAEELEIA